MYLGDIVSSIKGAILDLDEAMEHKDYEGVLDASKRLRELTKDMDKYIDGTRIGLGFKEFQLRNTCFSLLSQVPDKLNHASKVLQESLKII